MEFSTSPRSVPSLPATTCEHCGALDVPRLAPGNGPHAFRDNCAHCGAFLRWVSKYTPAERAARRQQALAERGMHYVHSRMRGKPATTAQHALLKALGADTFPTDRAEASALIQALQQKGGAR